MRSRDDFLWGVAGSDRDEDQGGGEAGYGAAEGPDEKGEKRLAAFGESHQASLRISTA